MVSKRNILSVIAVFIAIFAFEWIYHGILLMPTYIATASLWRPEAEMQAMFPWCIITKLGFSILFVWLFARFYENKGIQEGVRFGLFIGLITGLHAFTSYMYLPIPIGLACAWLVGEVLKLLLVGVVLSYVFRLTSKA